MRRASFLIFVALSFAQQRTTGPAQSAGTCSVANSRVVTNLTIDCTGLTPTQRTLIAGMPELLNRLLASQAESNSEILARLDACLGGRSLSDAQKAMIRDELLSAEPGEITISAYLSAEDGRSYGTDIGNAILSGHWKVAALNSAILSPFDNLRGVYIQVRDKDQPPSKAVILQRALKAAGIDAPFLTDSTKSADAIGLWIGRR